MRLPALAHTPRQPGGLATNVEKTKVCHILRQGTVAVHQDFFGAQPSGCLQAALLGSIH
jgi:hypothetical protein